MCPPPDDEHRAMAHNTQQALNPNVAIVILVVRTALADYLRPGISFTPGASAEVDPRPPQGSASAPPLSFRSLEATVNFTQKVLIATAAVIMLTACGSAPVTTSTQSVTTSPASASPPVDARDHAVAAYRQMWSNFAIAGKTSDWQSSSLGRYATGIALTKLSQSLHGDHDKGIVTKGEPVLNPSVSTVEPQDNPMKITIADCGDSTQFLKYRKDNDALVDDKPGGRHRINATVEKQADGSWKVSDYGVHDVGSC
jgi:hypothetical protein